MRIEELASDGIRHRPSAIEIHAKMREAKLPPAEFGRLYEMLLTNKMWPSQASLAKALGVAKSHVARTVAIHRLPAPVQAVLGGPEKITHATAHSVARLIKANGPQVVIERAEALAAHGSMSNERVLHYLANGRIPSPQRVSISVSFDVKNEFIKIESPDIYRLSRLIPQIEATLCILMGMAPPRKSKPVAEN
jgi:hypothetical protein